jgi:hypothetical protein
MGESMTKPFSPAAQAVRHVAICAGPELEGRIAAALRAVADQVVPENRFGPPDNAAAVQREITRAGILAIAAELKTSTTENLYH